MELLTSAQSGKLDQQAISAGQSGPTLMARATRGITRTIVERFEPSPTLVICGPGNNGGDGLLVAHRLRRIGWPVTVASEPVWRARRGDAAWAGSIWGNDEITLAEAAGRRWSLVVDAVFGAGFSRSLELSLARLFAAIAANSTPVVAVDVPSGVNGTTGSVDAASPKAAVTVTFARLKRGHVLLPARSYCGELVVVDIGIADTDIAALAPLPQHNTPEIWRSALPRRTAVGNKYTSGHTLVVAGPGHRCGAAIMSAQAAQAAGSGLVTLACRSQDFPVFAAHSREEMLTSSEQLGKAGSLLDDRRTTAVVIGPALGLDDRAIDLLSAALATQKPVVVDADAITLLGNHGGNLRDLLQAQVIITPHDGEFARICDSTGNRLDRALEAAKALGVVVLLKGGDTVVAAPDGRSVVNAHAPPSLAVAGSGDVLAGIAGALLARGMPTFEAAAAAAWLHGEAGRRAGTALPAGELTPLLSHVLRDIEFFAQNAG